MHHLSKGKKKRTNAEKLASVEGKREFGAVDDLKRTKAEIDTKTLFIGRSFEKVLPSKQKH